MYRIGSYVKFAVWPGWADSLPEESLRVFRYCFGKSYMIVDSENQILVLDVSEVDSVFGGYKNTIYLESSFVEQA